MNMTQSATHSIRSADGTHIAYDHIGTGPAILLIHGFASSRIQNWKDTGWYDTLTRAGYSIIAMDCRGHGDSDKPHDSDAYDHAIMAADALSVIQHTGQSPLHLMGYSMGGFLAMHLLLQQPEQLKKVVLAGVGGSYLDATLYPGDRMADPATRNRIADALLTPDPTTISDQTARAFRLFADQGGKDRLALAACMRAMRRNFTAEELSRASRETLVVCGQNDLITGPPDPLAAAFPHGRAITVPRRDHMTTVGDKAYKQAVLDFLAYP